MSDYVLNWGTTGADGSAVLTSGAGGADIGVTVSTPSNGAGDSFELTGSNLTAGYVSCDTSAIVSFDQPVTNLTFTLFDVDAGCGWDDLVTIVALDADGNELEVVFTDLAAHHTTTGDSVEGGGVAGGSADNVTVTIIGDVASLGVTLDNGDSAHQSGVVGIGPMSFDAATALDGIVEGTDGDDLIDLAYTGDPDGDRIDAGDAILPGEAPDDDKVFAGAGNDTVYAGKGDDELRGQSGNDILYGEEGDDDLSGGSGDDRLYGGTGADLLFGGSGDDFLDGGSDDDADVLRGGSGADYFTGVGAGDDVRGDSTGDDNDTLDLRGSAPDGGSLQVTVTHPDWDGNGFDGIVTYYDDQGRETGQLTFDNIENIIPCFTPGTRIATLKGERLVEDLRPGDKIITRDNGIQEIRWTGRRDLTAADLAAAPHLQPVLIKAGSLGHGLPEQDMLVSPNHRMLVASDITALYFGESEALAAAKHLTSLGGVATAARTAVSYLHFMFDRHEVVLANGSWTESFQPGDYTLGGMGAEQRNEIFELFPDLATAKGQDAYHAARRVLKKHEAALLTSI